MTTIPNTYPPAESSGQAENLSSMFGLVSALESHGCTVSNSEQYKDLTLKMGLQSPERPTSLLTMKPTQVTDYLRERAITGAGRQSIAAEMHELRQQLQSEMAASMNAEVDSYIEVLRPKFHAAAAEARAVTALGVRPEDDPEQVMSRGGSASEYWISFKSGSTALRQLVYLSKLRGQLAEVTGAGEGAGGDHSIGITRPYIQDALKPSAKGEQPHVKWLRWADHLELVPFSELDPDAVLAARGHDVTDLRQELARQMILAKPAS